MKHLELVKVGENKGAPRVWIEGRKASIAGFLPGTRYHTKIDTSKSMLTLEVADDGMRIVSRKTRGEQELPVLDLNSHELLSMFDGLESVRVVVANKRIHILPVASELRAKERLERAHARLAAKEPVTMGSMASGIGVLDLAAHEGLALAGLESSLLWSNEIRDDCTEHAVARNPAYGPETITLTMPMQELVFDQFAMSQLPSPTLLIAGLPCSGASVAGKSKRGLEHAESHPDVGHLVVSFIAMVAAIGPLAVTLENVLPYRNTASMAIIRSSLRDLGYIVHEAELDASEWNLLEHRKRMVMVAVTKGIEFDLHNLKRPEPVQHTFGEIMDDVDPSHTTWGDISYLWAKRERDAAQGKGFEPTVIDALTTKVPTQTKNLAKRQSTGTFIRHPTQSNLYRIPTVAEHARLKGIPEVLVDGTTQGFGHESLGQSISMPPFVAVFEQLGRSLRAFGEQSSKVAHPVFSFRESLFAA